MLPAARAEAGFVFADTQASWWNIFLSECLGFPNTAFKDQVDSFSLAVHMISENPPEKPRKIVVNPMRHSRQREVYRV
jgi:phage terminase large subunit-like protein